MTIARRAAYGLGVAAEPILVAGGIRKRFGALVVLDGVDFAVGADEAVGIVGPNGAGKTTLLNVLAGALRPDAGSVSFAGAEVTRMGAAARCRLGVARAHQIPKPFDSMSVRDNVAVACMFSRLREGVEGGRHRADEYLSVVGLEERADALPREINLHQRQLLELARALASRG